MTDPMRYLASIAASRPLFLVLYEDAMGMLPPHTLTADPEPLLARASVAKLADKLHVSRSTVQADLVRLENFRWIRRGVPRQLGSRVGGVVYLLADIAAQEATGEPLLVTAHVIPPPAAGRHPGLAPQNQTRPPSSEVSGTGAARRWRPT